MPSCLVNNVASFDKMTSSDKNGRSLSLKSQNKANLLPFPGGLTIQPFLMYHVLFSSQCFKWTGRTCSDSGACLCSVTSPPSLAQFIWQRLVGKFMTETCKSTLDVNLFGTRSRTRSPWKGPALLGPAGMVTSVRVVKLT